LESNIEAVPDLYAPIIASDSDCMSQGR
jgi:hypothetical protein